MNLYKNKIENFYRLKGILYERGLNLFIYDKGFYFSVRLEKFDVEFIFKTPLEELLPYCKEILNIYQI
jgi:hypothetical protein